MKGSQRDLVCRVAMSGLPLCCNEPSISSASELQTDPNRSLFQEKRVTSTVVGSLLLLIFLLDIPVAARLSIAPPPRHPTQTVESGLVVLDLSIDAGGE